MTVEVWGMIVAGVATLVAGPVLVRKRFLAATGVDKPIVLGPVCAAAALAVFAMEHFLAARELMSIVPRWLPGPLFWTYFVGVGLMAAAVSFLAWRWVRWSAPLLALLFLIIVTTIDLPNLPAGAHNRIFWVLTVREMAFAGGAMVLTGSIWGREIGSALIRIGRTLIGLIFLFYAAEHFLFPRNVPGVPLEKLTPVWMPAPVFITYAIGITLLVAGIGLLLPRTARIAAAGSGTVLLLLTLFFYLPILVAQLHTSLAVEGLNYFFDTLLFAATALLAGFSANHPIA